DSFSIDITEVRAFLDKVLDNERRLPFDGPMLTGAWTQKWTNETGLQVYCGVTLRPDGTVLWEDQKGAYEGTYSLYNGQLTLVVPGLSFETTCELNWSGNDTLTITRNGIEYKLIRR
ncbi:MAG TPA: hypothetical protein VE988_19140, partial [Gemmataceae bacterium]|nr:hypothetical protein [Gemmataceae bacterium]